MKQIRAAFKQIRKWLFVGSGTKNAFIDFALAHAPFELLGCE